MGILRDIGAPGVIVIVIGALLLFGPKRLPELGESIGKMFVQFKRTVHELTEESDTKEKTSGDKEAN